MWIVQGHPVTGKALASFGVIAHWQVYINVTMVPPGCNDQVVLSSYEYKNCRI